MLYIGFIYMNVCINTLVFICLNICSDKMELCVLPSKLDETLIMYTYEEGCSKRMVHMRRDFMFSCVLNHITNTFYLRNSTQLSHW